MKVKINEINKIKRVCEMCNQFVDDVYAISGKHRVNAKSILGLLSLDLSQEIDLVIDTPAQGIEKSKDGFIIRRHAIETGVSVLTSLDTADALLTSLEKANKEHLTLVDIADL